MGVTAADRVVIVTDANQRAIADALAFECELADAPSLVQVIEDHGARPMMEVPARMLAAIDEFRPTVSFYAASSEEGELPGFRRPLMDHLFHDLKCRHGHMVGITEQLMAEGMTADYEAVSRLTYQVNDIVKDARLIEVQAPSGTDLRAQLDPSRLRWVPCPGIYHARGEWGNLPEGETYTSPARVDGVVGGEVLGDHFSHKYGILSEPMRFEVDDSRIRKITFPDDEVRLDVERYMAQYENSNRAGEFAIGTNTALKRLSGNLLQDEKIPGMHMAFGFPYGEHTGAGWDCPSHCDVVATRSTIKVDGQYLMRDGEFVF